MLTGALSRDCTAHGHCEKCGSCILDFTCGVCGHVQRDPYGLQAKNASALYPVGIPYCILHKYAPGDHRDCIVNTCRVCANPVTNGQVSDGDAHLDGDDVETYVHRECAMESKYGE